MNDRRASIFLTRPPPRRCGFGYATVQFRTDTRAIGVVRSARRQSTSRPIRRSMRLVVGVLNVTSDAATIRNVVAALPCPVAYGSEPVRRLALGAAARGSARRAHGAGDFDVGLESLPEGGGVLL